MADACCGPDPSPQDVTDAPESGQRLWHVRDLQIALKWIALGQQIFAAGAGPWAQIKGVLAARYLPKAG